MNENEKVSDGGQVLAGVFVATFLGLIILVTLFVWSPAAHYLGKWNEYWEKKDTSTSFEIRDTRPDPYWENSNKAAKDCKDRADKHFEVESRQVLTYTSSTVPDYSTYDCYAIKMTKIPEGK